MIGLYVAGLAAIAGLVGVLLAVGGSRLPPAWALVLLALIGIAAERGSVRFSDRLEASIAFVPVLFAAVAFGPLAAFAVGGLAMLGDFRRPYLKWATYTSSRALAGAGAGAVASIAGAAVASGAPIGRIAVAAFAAGLAAELIDAIISSLTGFVRDPGRRVDVVAIAPALALSIALYAPLVALLVFAYQRLSPWALVLFIVPAMAAQHLFVLYQRERRLVGRLDAANSAFAASLVAALEERDRYTAGHSNVVASCAQKIAAELKLSQAEQETAFSAGLLHDVGKVAVSPAILDKPGHLTVEEWAQMEKHPVIGERILSTAEDYAETATIVRHHHERFDGGGYPDRLAGAEIPLLSRIVGVADAYNAMVSIRPYRGALPTADARAELWREAGTQFDPAVVAAFDRVLERGGDAFTIPTDAVGADTATAGNGAGADRTPRPAAAPVHAPAVRAATANGSYRKLADVFHELLAEQGVEAVLQRVADALATLVPYSTLTIYQADEQAQMLVPTLVRDRWASEIFRNPIPFGRGITGWAVLNRQPVVLADGHLDPRAEIVPGTPADDPEAVISIPLIARDAIKGALNIYREGDGSSFLPEEFELARRFADAAALALDNAHLRSDLEQRAQTDSLTGLYNHRFFHETLQNELRRGSASRKRVCLLMLDIDDFKQINDSHGHGTGDRVLTNISTILRSLVRDEDVVCRLGGEEFAIVMPSCDEEGALACATRIHASIQTYRFQHEIQITVSTGIANSQQTTDPAALAEAADTALLAAKAAGKNRTTVYNDNLAPPDERSHPRALATA